MATGFKKATVNASSVPATQTNFPSYVDLSRIGITTLAEAQSVRVYADSGKTTEWAREIVSATEMHVKVPSLTSTVDMYVDWDGTSADYAATDTYGRNAVWTGNEAVWHLNDVNDSTGNSRTLTNENSCTFVAAQISNGGSQGSSNTNKRFIIANNLGFTKSTDYTMKGWIKLNTAATGLRNLFDVRYATDHHLMYLRTDTPSSVFTLYAGYASNGIGANEASYAFTMGTSVFHHLAVIKEGTTLRLYLNGTEVASVSTSSFANGTSLTNSATLGASGNGFIYASAIFDQVIYDNAAYSANWITTEYNNQSDEATFWGTWTTVGGGATFVSKTSWLI